MSDAPRRDHASEPEETTPPVVPAEEADQPDPDALGARPGADDEEHAVPAEPATAADGASPPTTAGAGDEVDDAQQVAERTEAAEDPRSREELLAALADAEGARDDYLDGMRRARAEFENYRKRTMREGVNQREAGRAEIAEGLLEVLDDLDRTLEAAEASSDEVLAKGVQLVAEKLVGALRSSGLERVDATGVPFDPNLHEAVQQVAAEQEREDPLVAQVLRPGYVLGERVLRAAMVVVEQ